MSISDASSLLGIVLTCLYQPVATRLSRFRRLKSNAERLSKNTGELEALKEDVYRRVENLEKDPSKQRSDTARGWFVAVQDLVGSSAAFHARFNSRRWSCNCFRCGCYSIYKLTEEAEGLLQEAADLKTRGNAFTDPASLVSPVPEFLLILKTLHSKTKSLQETIKDLGNLRDRMEGKVSCLIKSQDDHEMMISSGANNWFQQVDSAIRSYSLCMETFETKSRIYCSRTPSTSFSFTSSCFSETEACDACIDKYKFGVEMINSLLEHVVGLRNSGDGISEDELIAPVPKFALVLRSLEEKARSLSTEMGNLEYVRADKAQRAGNLVRQSEGMMMISKQAMHWFEMVESAAHDSTTCFETFQRKSRVFCSNTPSTSFSFTSSCFSSQTEDACDACTEKFILGKQINALLEQVDRLRKNGEGFNDGNLVVAAGPVIAEEIPIYHQVVGQTEELAKALELIYSKEEELGMIGVFGMGGCGKSTLMHRINNHFLNSTEDLCDFDVVISVSAGRDMSVPNMQKEIGRRLGLSYADQSEVEQARRILRALGSMNFLLLLDDLWVEIDLNRLGIPPLMNQKQGQKRRKMVITARDEKICHQMGARDTCMIHMELLTKEASWELFCRRSQIDEILRINPELEAVVRDVMDECGCLPLALIAVGTTMAGAKQVYEWENARSKLRASAHRFPGVEEKVLLPLSFSFDHLHNDAMREILFFCTVCPQNSITPISLIAVNIALEGLLHSPGSCSNFLGAQCEALYLISRLVDSGLLMWYSSGKQFVEMHDCVRDMLLWLMETDLDDHYPKMVTWSPQTDQHLSSFFKTWEHARRISMDDCNLVRMPKDIEIPCCNRLVNITWRYGSISRLPDRFFDSMTCLRVLDLKNTNITKLPRLISSLSFLTSLNLSFTPITELPVELGDLKELVVLYLNYTSKLVHIPRKSISRLCKLELLFMGNSAFQWTWECNHGGAKQLALRDIEELVTTGALRRIAIYVRNEVDALMNGIAGLIKEHCFTLLLR